ncbi:MAG: hypothetical protein ACI84O_001403 [Myxococcota bacterium]|jgi:hypothetical protein
MLVLKSLLDLLADIESGKRKLGPADKDNPMDPWLSDPLHSEMDSALVASKILDDSEPYSKGAERLWLQFPENLDSESTQTLKDWVHRLTRSERFCAGSILSAAESGHLGRVIRALQQRV